MKSEFEWATEWATEFDVEKHVEDYFKTEPHLEDTIENWIPRLRENPEDLPLCPDKFAKIIISNPDFKLSDFIENYPEYFI